MNDDGKTQNVEDLLGLPDLAEALQGGRFRQFLDKIPIAILIAPVAQYPERIIYANAAFEALTGLGSNQVEGKTWDILEAQRDTDGRALTDALVDAADHLGAFRIALADGETALVEAHASVIETEGGEPDFRLVALIDVTRYVQAERERFAQSIRDRDLLLLELQHRVKNNLQMITALIRLEARAPDGATLDRLAGRIEALNILHQCLAADGHGQEIDLGAYLSQVASAVMRSHAVEGIRLSLKADVYVVSVNVAMPSGLIVNEVMTNALKHAFKGRDGGTITLECIVGDDGYKVVVADDGVGLPAGTEWPSRGNLGALIVRSLKENAKAEMRVDSIPGQGTRITLTFNGDTPAPEPILPMSTI